MIDTETCAKIVASVINHKLLWRESSQHNKEPDLEDIDIFIEDIIESGLSKLDFARGLGYMQEKGHIHMGMHSTRIVIEGETIHPLPFDENVVFDVTVHNDGSWHTYNITNSNKVNEEITFNLDSGVLVLGGEEIRLSSHSKKTQGHQLLAYLATHPEEVLDYKHMPYDVFGEIYEWKTYYNAAQDIRDKIAKKTRVMDFIKYTSGENGNVSISEKYQGKIKVS